MPTVAILEPRISLFNIDTCTNSNTTISTSLYITNGNEPKKEDWLTDFKRLIAFTGLKIVNIDILETGIIINLKRNKEKFKLLVCKDGKMILYNSQNEEIMRIKQKEEEIVWPPNYPNVLPSSPITNPGTFPWITYSSDGTSISEPIIGNI